VSIANKRILVVDDSCLYQRLLSDIINSGNGLEVVGVASNGEAALNMMSDTRPDLVTLDILMPEMDGIQTLIELRKKWPSVRIVMVSSLSSDGSDAALDALALGAHDYTVKPSFVGGIAETRNELKNQLLPKIEALCGIDTHPEKNATLVKNTKPRDTRREDVASTPRASAATIARSIEIVAIGVSTGGPDALARLLSQLPPDLDVPIVIVQHMPAEFTAKLATRLDKASALNVVEAQMGDKLQPNTVYIAPGSFHMVLDKIGSDVVVTLNKNPEENSCRPSVDPLFRSIPPIYKNKCLGVVMTGMGADGLNGCKALNEAGCPIVVQDKKTSIVWGMPKLVARAGFAQQEVPLDSMAEVVTDIVRNKSMSMFKPAVNASHFHQVSNSGRSL